MNEILKKRWLLIFIFTVHPIGALISDIVQGFSQHHLQNLNFGGYLLATGFAAMTPFLFILFYKLGPEFIRSNKVVYLTFVFLMASLTIFAQSYAYLYLHTDAQAALGFLFGPVYVSFAYGLIGLILLVGLKNYFSKRP